MLRATGDRLTGCRWRGSAWTSRCHTWTGPSTTWCAAGDDEAAQPGTRVRVRFAGQLVDGWLLERRDVSEHPGRLSYLERVVSPERVLHPEVLAAARAVAHRYAGNLADVLRLAVPPRHARVEAEPPGPPAPPGPTSR